MTDLWYNNPLILLNDYTDFFPHNSMNKTKKINAIARFALYYGLIIVLLQLDSKWLSVSICLFILSFFLGYVQENIKNTNCTNPTLDNPYMNFTLGDLINNPQRPAACPIDDVRKDQIKMYKSTTLIDSNDLWGKFFNDRNFYTMPSTGIVNDQSGFANYVFGDFGHCKSDGQNCIKHIDNRFARGRYYYTY